MKDFKGYYSRDWNDLNREQIYKLFIKPELAKRSTTSPIDFSKVYKVLIKLPKEKDPIVEFNEEIGFTYRVEETEKGSRNQGESLNYYDIKEIKEILPPKVDNRSVAFIYAWRIRDRIHFAFDFSPKHPDFDENTHELSAGIRRRLHCEILEFILIPVKNTEDKLLKIGMAIFPALIPFPINIMVKHLNEGETDKASQAIENHCDSDFIERLIKNWYSVDILKDRQLLFDEALQAHSCGLYHIAINALIGQIEGIITDWLHRTLGDDEAKKYRGYKTRFEKFKCIVEDVVSLEYVEELILQSICKFLVSPETILQRSGEWESPSINPNAPSRHIIQHGKYIPAYYTMANSIKIFLMIDSICWCIQCYTNYKDTFHKEVQ